MAQDSKIQWTHHTFNPWVGCTKVSDGCKFCYAETLMDTRYGKAKWGPKGTRVIKADSGWREPLKWNRLAEQAGERHRVFCASLADVFEGGATMPAEEWPKVEAARARLFDLIYQTPQLDWLLLTKRPENIMAAVFRAYDGEHATGGSRPMLQRWWYHLEPPPNVWLGTSVENQQAVGRVDCLRQVPAVVRFLSCEPLIGPVDLPLDGIDWVIVGGESGPGARPCDVDGIRSVVRQCRDATVPVFVKQLGGNVRDLNTTSASHFPDNQCWPKGTRTDHHRVLLNNRKGGDPSEWPEDLRVRQFPEVSHV